MDLDDDELCSAFDVTELASTIEQGRLNVLPQPMAPNEVDDLIEAVKADPARPFDPDMLARLAIMRQGYPADYVRLRSKLKNEKVRVTELDRVLSKTSKLGIWDDVQCSLLIFPAIEPWDAPVDGDDLLHHLVSAILHYVVMPMPSAVGIALWIVHAHCFNVFNRSPRLVITSPEKRCGKTTVLEIVGCLVSRPLQVSNATAAALFRTIHAHRPALLIDEADTFLPDNEEVRGIMNSGDRPSGSVLRLVGDDHIPRQFGTFCPMAIAAIGRVPDTIEDRSIPVALRRRLPSEKITRFRDDRVDHLHELRRRVARWAADNSQQLRTADPEMPIELHDRACDNWRPLIAIADIAGGKWPKFARKAAKELTGLSATQVEPQVGPNLLADIKQLFDMRAAQPMDKDRISSTQLADLLNARPDSRWSGWSRGRGITSAAVARLLKGYDIVPTTVKLWDGSQPNGYKRKQFDDAFARYLTSPLASDASPNGSPLPQVGSVGGSPKPVKIPSAAIYDDNEVMDDLGPSVPRRAFQPQHTRYSGELGELQDFLGRSGAGEFGELMKFRAGRNLQ